MVGGGRAGRREGVGVEGGEVAGSGECRGGVVGVVVLVLVLVSVRSGHL